MSRTSPYDPALKTLLSIGHIFSFSLYYGATVFGADIPLARSVVLITGVLLAAREVYKGGRTWFSRTDGICTLVKIVLIATDDLFTPLKPLILSGVVLLGIFAAHLPDSVRKRYWFGARTVRS